MRELGLPDLGDAATFTEGPPFEYWSAAPNLERVWSEALQREFWSATGWDVCQRILSSDRQFSSAYGMMLGFDMDSPDLAGQQMLVVSDGPKHQALRTAMKDFFSPRYVRSLSADMKKEISGIIAPLVGAGDFDFVEDVAAQIPMIVVARILGIPREDWEYLFDLSNMAFGSADEEYNASLKDMTSVSAHSEILYFFSELVEYKMGTPGQDLVSHLVGLAGKQSVSFDDVILACDNILIGGNETTRHSLAGAVVAFNDHPHVWTDLKRRPDRNLGSVVDEVLRWTSPAMHVLRTVTEDVQIDDQLLRSGDSVAVWIAAANRDPIKFGQGSTFDIDRQAQRHMALGHGSHHCLGANLARMEISILLECLLDQVSTIAVSQPPRRLKSNLVAGYKTVRCQFV